MKRKWPLGWVVGSIVISVALLAGCGSSSESSGDPPSDDALSGITRPEPLQVGDVTVPDVTTDGDGGQFAMRAAPGELLIAYFGYTSCPDICPTTLADLRTALQQAGPNSDRVDMGMVTVDPERDRGPALSNYLDSFLTRYHALREPDLDTLAQIEAPFGASSSVQAQPDGTVEVSHTAITYVIDEHGTVLVEWPFGTDADAMAEDLRVLLDQVGSAT